MSQSSPQPPFTPIWLTRFLVLCLVLVSLAAGYYQATLKLYQKRYWSLEQKYLKAQAELTKYQTNH